MSRFLYNDINIRLIIILIESHILSEKRVLPSVVLASFVVYFAVATIFYFDV